MIFVSGLVGYKSQEVCEIGRLRSERLEEVRNERQEAEERREGRAPVASHNCAAVVI